MNTLRTEVRLFAESGDFDPDRLNYMDCPECGGAKKCMVVPAENGRGYYFKCFRDSCGVSGLTGGGLGRHMSTGKLHRLLYPRPDPDALKALTGNQTEHLKRRYHLTHSQVGRLCAGYDHSTRSFVFPIRGPVGQERGYVARSFNRLPKAPVRPYEHEGALTAWYSPHDVSVYNAPLVLVEDQISAARLSNDVPTVALLGTHLTLAGEAEVVSWCKTRPGCPVIVSLDNDATTTGVDLTKELTGLPGVWAYYVPLYTDVKDMSKADYDYYLVQLRGICQQHEQRLRISNGN